MRGDGVLTRVTFNTGVGWSDASGVMRSGAKPFSILTGAQQRRGNGIYVYSVSLTKGGYLDGNGCQRWDTHAR